MLEISEKTLVGDAVARRRSRKRGDSTASRRNSGSSVFASALAWIWRARSFLTSGVVVDDD
jgi:hypothetical protein